MRAPAHAWIRSRPVPERLLASGLVLAVLLAFAPTLRNDFVGWDDARNFAGAEWRGLGWAQLRWIATASHGGHYMPVTWLTYAVDYTLWGLSPRGFHATSLLVHALAVVLCYRVALRVLGRALGVTGWVAGGGAAAAALLFGLHPLRVESVAWATERRDVVSGALFLGTVLLYLRAVDAAPAARGRWLAGSWALHGAALLAKAITMTAPAVLLLLDVYPLRRLPADPRQWWSRQARAVLREKLPYLALSAGGAALAWRAQILDHGMQVHAAWPVRLANAAFGFWFYATKTLLPVGLSPLYEAPERLDPLEGRFVVSAVGVVLVTGVAWLGRRRWPGVLAAWGAYLVMLAPVSGLIPLGQALAADRYSYLPCLPFALLAGGALAGLLAREGRRARLAVVALTVGVALFLGGQTWRQVHVWRDGLALWSGAVAATPWCGLCRLYLGTELFNRRQYLDALDELERAVAMRPERPTGYRAIGLIMEHYGFRGEAIAWYRRGLARVPSSVEMGISLATALVAEDQLAEATAALATPVARWRAMSLVHHFERVVASQPSAPVPRLGLVLAWVEAGDRDRASAALDGLRQVHPGLATAAEAVLTRAKPL